MNSDILVPLVAQQTLAILKEVQESAKIANQSPQNATQMIASYEEIYKRLHKLFTTIV